MLGDQIKKSFNNSNINDNNYKYNVDNNLDIDVNYISVYINFLHDNNMIGYYNIVLKVISNICSNPNNIKFLELKRSNTHIKEFMSIKENEEFIYYLGFSVVLVDNIDTLIMLDPNVERLNSILYYIKDINKFNNISKEANKFLSEDNCNNKIINNNKLEDTDFNNFKDVQSNNINICNKKKITEILKSTSYVRDNNIKTYQNNLYSIDKKKEATNIKNILKDTAEIRANKKNFNNNIYTINSIANNNNNSISNLSNEQFVGLHKYNNLNPHIYSKESVFPNTNTNSNLDYIGMSCLELTNQFRLNNKLSILIWDSCVWKICFVHSKNMGDGKVPFGHHGFNNRVKECPYNLAAYENVFMCYGFYEGDISKQAVNGWINSPGHKKNLLSNSTHCAIACYKCSKGYYLTQIFIKK